MGSETWALPQVGIERVSTPANKFAGNPGLQRL